MRHHDGSLKFDRIESALKRDGFVLEFGTSYGMGMPEKLIPSGEADGWAIRRHIKRWCADNGHSDYRILRNTSFHRDLHGVVYQLWIRRPADRAMGGES